MILFFYFQMSAKDLQDMSLDKFSMWTIPSLKDFLKKKGMQTSGVNKQTLVARAFCAWENNVQDKLTSEEIRLTCAKEYQLCCCLVVNKERIDPFKLNNWQDENKSMSLWPPIFLRDISDYLVTKEHDVFSTELRQRLLKDYKDQKSFSFFTSNWLLEIFYHPVFETSEACFLKADCTPSQRLGNPPYTAWVCGNKQTGKIYSAYCSCFAG